MKKIFILAIILFSVVCNNTAQETWSLEKCINYAKEHNILLQKQILNAEIQKNNAKQAKFNLLPTINGSAGHNYYFGRSIDFATNTYVDRNQQSSNFSLNTDVTLFNGFKKVNILKKSEINLLANLQDVEKAKADLALDVTSLYLIILFKKELLQVAQEQLKITQLQIKRTKVLVEAGTIPKATLMEQQAQAAREELSVVNAQNDLDLALLDLVQLLDIKTNEGFEIAVPELPVLNAAKLPDDPKSVYTNALEFRPEIKAAKYRLQSSEKEFSIASADLMPRLSMGGSWNTGYSNTQIGLDLQKMKFSDQLKNNESKNFGFSLQIPIFNGKLINRNMSNAKIYIKQTKLDLENSKNILQKEIQQAYANALAAMKKYFSSKTAVSSTEEAFRYTEEKFNLGLVNSVEYNEAKNNLVKSKSDLLQAKYEYIFRTKIIDFYNGTEIKL